MRKHLRMEQLESRRLLASDWQNANRFRDANNDSFVTPIDALVGINRLNDPTKVSQLPARPADSTEPYYDVNGDGFHSALDVLLVINALNGGLRIDMRLANDTGFGANSDRDGLTKDASIQGIVTGQLEYLQVQLDGTGPWYDLRAYRQADGRIFVSEDQLESLIGQPLAERAHTFELRAGETPTGTQPDLPDRMQIQLQLDQTPPRINLLGPIKMTQADTITVPLTVPIEPEFFSTSSVKVYDVTWGEGPESSPFEMDGTYPRLPVQPLSIQLANDNRQLIIRVPEAGRSIKYRIELDSALRDRAGNESIVDAITANYFTPTAAELGLGQTLTINNLVESATVHEYSLSLARNQAVVWAGDQILQSRSRVELYDSHGQMREVVQPWTPAVTFQPRTQLWSLAAGNYRLRVVDPPINQTKFELKLLEDVPVIEPSQPQTGAYLEFDLYRGDFSAGQQLDMVGLRSDKPILYSVIDPYGQELDGVDLVGSQPRILFENTGTHLLTIFRNGYTSSLSEDEVIIASGSQYSGQFTEAGKKQWLSFSTTPGTLYTLTVTTGAGARVVPNSLNSSDKFQLENNQWLFLANRESIGLRLESIGPDATYTVQLRSLAGVEALQFNTPIPSPDLGSARFYWSDKPPTGQQLRLDGNKEFAVFQISEASIARAFIGSGSLFANQLDDRFLVRVKATTDDADWIATDTQLRVQPLVFDAVEQLEFTSGLERYEFTFSGQLNDLVVARLRSGFWQNYGLSLLGPNGESLPLTIGQWPGATYLLRFPGEHRLVVAGKGPNSIGSVSWEVSRPSDWPILAAATPVTVPQDEVALYRLPTGLEHLYLRASSSEGISTWAVANDLGEIIFDDFIVDRSNGQLVDLDLQLPPAEQHYLIVRSAPSRAAVDTVFERLTTVSQTRDVALGATAVGTLVQPGDRVILKWQLTKGQRVALTNVSPSNGALSAQWLGIPEGTSLNLMIDSPWLVPRDGTYQLEVIGHRANVNYSVTLSSVAMPSLGKGTAGFNVIREGSIVPFNVDQYLFQTDGRTLVSLEWLDTDGNGDIIIEVSTLTGTEIFRSSGSDHLIDIPDAGVYQVKLSAASSGSAKPYKFILRDLAAAPLINLDQLVNGTLGPRETQLYRLQLSQATDLLVVPGSLRSVIGLRTVMAGQELGATYPGGTLAVVASNFLAEPANFEFKVISTSSLPLVTFSQNTTLTLQPGQDTFRLITSRLQSITFTVPEDFVVSAHDVYGNEYSASSNKTIQFPLAGEYLVKVGQIGLLPTTTRSVGLIAPVAVQQNYDLDTRVEVTLNPGDQYEYQFNLAADTRLALGISYFDSNLIELETATGKRVNLYAVTDNASGDGPGVQFLQAGSYILRLTGKAMNSKVWFQVSDLSQAQAVPATLPQFTLPGNQLFQIYRYEAVAGRTLRLNPLPDNSAEIYFYRLSDQHQSSKVFRFGPSTVTFTASETICVIVLGSGTRVSWEFTATQESTFAVAPGTVYAGVIAQAGDTHELRLNVTSSDAYFEFDNASVDAWLLSPLGTVVGLNRPLSNLMLGEYRLRLSSSGPAAAYSFRYQLLDASALVLLGSSPMQSNQFYRFQLDDRTTLRAQLTRSGQPVDTALLEIWQFTGGLVGVGASSFSMLGGSYWLRVRADETATYQLQLGEFAPTLTSAQVGQTVELELDSTTPVHTVTMPVSAGTVLMLEHWTNSSAVGRLRFVSNLGRSDTKNAWAVWNPPQPWTIDQDGTLEVVWEGTGAVSFRLFDLRLAAVLTPTGTGNVVMAELPAGHGQIAWRLATELGQDIHFETLLPKTADFQWLLLNERGETVTSVNQGESWSVVNDSPLYLVGARNSGLSESLDLRVGLRVG